MLSTQVKQAFRPAFFIYIELASINLYICLEALKEFVIQLSKTKTLTFLNACIYKRVLPCFLLLAFINTAVFPSLLLVIGKTTSLCEVRANSETTGSLTEYILEVSLHVQDITPDEQEEDINEFENLVDEVDLLTYIAATVEFRPYAQEIPRSSIKSYPLSCSCFGSATPPPEPLLG